MLQSNLAESALPFNPVLHSNLSIAPTKKVSIRPAAITDVEWLIGELKAFDQFFDAKRPLFPSESYAESFLSNMIENHVVLIACEDSTQIGFIAGFLAPHIFNSRLVTLSEVFWWVSEKHRDGRAALMLLNRFVEIGKEKADWITMALEAVSNVNERTLLKRGFRLQEKSYLLEVR